MARNSVVEMVIEASNVEGVSGGTTRVVGGVVEVASGIGGAAGAGGTDSVGNSSCCGYSACGGIRGAGLSGGAATCVK